MTDDGKFYKQNFCPQEFIPGEGERCLLLLFLGRQFGLHGRHAVVGGADGQDGAVLVEEEAVDAYLAVEAGAHLLVEVGGVDAVVDDVPVVVAGHAYDAVVGGAEDFFQLRISNS